MRTSSRSTTGRILSAACPSTTTISPVPASWSCERWCSMSVRPPQSSSGLGARMRWDSPAARSMAAARGLSAMLLLRAEEVAQLHGERRVSAQLHLARHDGHGRVEVAAGEVHPQLRLGLDLAVVRFGRAVVRLRLAVCDADVPLAAAFALHRELVGGLHVLCLIATEDERHVVEDAVHVVMLHIRTAGLDPVR